jgi:hypothetical protein
MYQFWRKGVQLSGRDGAVAFYSVRTAWGIDTDTYIESRLLKTEALTTFL